MGVEAELTKIIERALRPLERQVEALRNEVATLRAELASGAAGRRSSEPNLGEQLSPPAEKPSRMRAIVRQYMAEQAERKGGAAMDKMADDVIAAAFSTTPRRKNRRRLGGP